MKYSGKLGFVVEAETEPGVYETVTNEVDVKGDIKGIAPGYTVNDSNSMNPEFNLKCKISFIASPQVLSNLGYMRYAIYKGQKWKVTSAIPNGPRIIITLGGLYNG